MAAKPDPNQWVVRIKPHSPRQTHHAHGIIFRREDGWVKVPADIARKLKTVRLHEMGEDRTKVFDVTTQDQAAKLDIAAERKKRAPGTAERPLDPKRGREVDPSDPEDFDEDEEPDSEPPPRRAARAEEPPEDDRAERLLNDLETSERMRRDQAREIDRLRAQLQQEGNGPPSEQPAPPPAPDAPAPPPVVAAGARPGAATAAPAEVPPKKKTPPGAAEK